MPLACSISGNHIGYGSDEGVKSLAEALKVNTGLKELKYAQPNAHAQSVSSR